VVFREWPQNRAALVRRAREPNAVSPLERSFCRQRSGNRPYGVLQPSADAAEVRPDLAFVPLVAFTGAGERLGQGGGHYDRWLAANPDALPLGLAWDCQLAEDIPHELHDRTLHAVVTPTRFYGGPF
jgi:5,10-methenyltetrahydrofolate synthetase